MFLGPFLAKCIVKCHGLAALVVGATSRLFNSTVAIGPKKKMTRSGELSSTHGKRSLSETTASTNEENEEAKEDMARWAAIHLLSSCWTTPPDIGSYYIQDMVSILEMQMYYSQSRQTDGALVPEDAFEVA